MTRSRSPRLLVAAAIATLALVAPAPAGAAYTAEVGSSGASMYAGSTEDTLVIDASGGYLRHNRHAAGDPGFASGVDFDTGSAGDQRVANATASLSIYADHGSIVLGSPAAPASALLSHISVGPASIGRSDGLDMHGPVNVTVDDSAATTAQEVDVTGAEVLFASGAEMSLYGSVITTLKLGSSADRVTFATYSPIDAAGGPGNDTFAFAGNTNLWSGTITGGAGINRLDYSAYTGPVATNLNAGTSTGTGKVTGISNVVGGAAGDTLTGGPGVNLLEGGPGDDVLDGGAGKDTLDGGDGADTVDYAKRTARVVVTLDQNDNDGTDANLDGVSEENDHDLGVERATGGAGNDLLRGNAKPNVLTGNAGKDKLEAFEGDDALDGGTGTDVLDGGFGTGDRIRYSSRTARVAVRLDGLANDGADPDRNGSSSAAEEGDQDIKIERATGGDGDDRLVGSDLPNELYGGPGNDTFDGRGGADVLDGVSGDLDTIDYSSRTNAVRVTLDGQAPDGETGEGDRDVAIDAVTGGAGSDARAATGNHANTLSGGPGADRLDGGPGPDVLDGGIHDDTADYSKRPSTDRVVVTLDEAPGDGSDPSGDGFSSSEEESDTDVSIEIVRGGAGDDRLTGRNLERDRLHGNGGADTINGLSGDDELFGGPGDDTVLGMSGSDFVIGGADDDTLLGSDGGDAVSGDSGNDKLYGEAGSDFVDGGAGDDTLDGGSGPDDFWGHAGVDTMTYATRTASQPVSVRLDGTANDGASGELDDDNDVENVIGGAGADFLYATVAGNTVVNKLYGGAGNDVLRTNDGTATQDELHCQGGDSDRFARDSSDLKSGCELPLVYRP